MYFDDRLRDSKFRVVEAPAFAPQTKIADTHAHLDMLHYPGLSIARAAANGVEFMVSVIDPTEDPSYTLSSLESWQKEARLLLRDWNKMTDFETRLIMGCHPHNASRYNQTIEDTLVQALTTDKRVVGIGEVGLDYHYDNSPRTVQQKVFRRQIQLAHEHQSTLTLHLREAHDDGLRILKEEGVPEQGLLLHCFNLDYATLEPFLELGSFVAFGGPLTFKKCDEVREAAAKAPLERLVTETDSPFMAPVPVRGSICEPASVVFTAQVLSELRSEADALEQIYQNAQGFFARNS